MDAGKKQNQVSLAQQRSNIYGLLSAVFRQEVTREFLRQLKSDQFLEVLGNLGFKLNDGFLKKPEHELLEDLAVEYARLFIGPGKHISPHESVHHKRDDGQWGQLWGASTGEVKEFIESVGLSYQDKYMGLPDHISVELEFMQEVTHVEEKAWHDGDHDLALVCREKEKRFIEEHLAEWVPEFCEKVMKEAELPFYRTIAGLTQKFIAFEKREIGRSGDSGLTKPPALNFDNSKGVV